MISKEQMREKIASESKAVIDVHTHVGISPGGYISQGYPYCLSLEDLAIRMNILGISYSVVFPFGSFYYALSRTKEKKVRVGGRISRFPYELANQNLLNEIYEIFPKYSQLFLPFGMFDPSRKQAAQVKQLKTLADNYPLYGLKTVTSYSQANIKDLLSQRGRCILDFARDLDIPVTIHTSVAPGDPWANVFSILDVVSDNPEVRFCLAHTCRFSKSALDTADRLNNCFVDLSAFHIHCQLAVQDSPSIADRDERFDADYDKPLEALKQLAEAYPQTLCWGTDTPAYYYINRWVDDRGRMHRSNLKCDWDVEVLALKKLDDKTRRRLAHDNPLRLLFAGKVV
jgi:predicted TIM-barrel fold metal-dependent hydrolase